MHSIMLPTTEILHKGPMQLEHATPVNKAVLL